MKNSTSLFLHRMFKGMADSCIKVFIPILIYQSTQNILQSFLFLIISYFLTAILFILLKNVIQKKPLLFLILHIIPIIIVSILLTCKITTLIIIILAVLDAITTVFYYASLNYMFVFLDKETNTAKFEAGQNAGKIIFVLVSSIILGNLNNSFIFVVVFSSILYVISVVPLCFKYGELKNITKNVVNKSVIEVAKQSKNFNLFHIFTGIFSFFNESFLPLYLFVNGISFSLIGVLVALNYLINIGAGYLAKYLSKKGRDKINLIINCIIICLAMAVLFVPNTTVLYIATVLLNFSYNMIFVAFFTMFINDQKEKGIVADSIFVRDIFQNGARVCCVGICMIPLSALGFIFGIGSSIGMLFTGLRCEKECKNITCKNDNETAILK